MFFNEIYYLINTILIIIIYTILFEIFILSNISKITYTEKILLKYNCKNFKMKISYLLFVYSIFKIMNYLKAFFLTDTYFFHRFLFYGKKKKLLNLALVLTLIFIKLYLKNI